MRFPRVGVLLQEALAPAVLEQREAAVVPPRRSPYPAAVSGTVDPSSSALQGRAILVTRSTRGIGLASARAAAHADGGLWMHD